MVAVHWSFVADGMIYRERNKLRLVMAPGKLGLKFSLGNASTSKFIIFEGRPL